MKTLGIIGLFLALSVGNTLPQNVSPVVTESAPELQILREQYDKAQETIYEDAQASSGTSITDIFSRSMTSLGNSRDRANSLQLLQCVQSGIGCSR